MIHLFFIPREQRDNPVLLLEYKVTSTPRYSAGEKQWDIGQIEIASWDNCISLTENGIDVAMVIFCPYHPRPLLCDFPDNELVMRRDKSIDTEKGSGTSYVNIDLQQFRTFQGFMEDRFEIAKELSLPLLKDFLVKAKNQPELQTSHHINSEYKSRRTAFNWEEPE
jgi:hypothetical protein